jgi:hypothetical protein
VLAVAVVVAAEPAPPHALKVMIAVDAIAKGIEM